MKMTHLNIVAPQNINFIEMIIYFNIISPFTFKILFTFCNGTEWLSGLSAWRETFSVRLISVSKSLGSVLNVSKTDTTIHKNMLSLLLNKNIK